MRFSKIKNKMLKISIIIGKKWGTSQWKLDRLKAGGHPDDEQINEQWGWGKGRRVQQNICGGKRQNWSLMSLPCMGHEWVMHGSCVGHSRATCGSVVLMWPGAKLMSVSFILPNSMQTSSVYASA